MIDEWGGLAELLANLIEKYATDLDIENMPDPERIINHSNSDIEEKYVDSPIAEKNTA